MINKRIFRISKTLQKIIKLNYFGVFLVAFGINLKAQDVFNSQVRKNLENSRMKQERIIQSLEKRGFQRIIRRANGEYSELVGQDETGKPLYYMTANQGAGTLIKVNTLYSRNSTVNTGTGMIIGMWDAASPRMTHTLLGSSRINYLNTEIQDILRHPTHIAGTLIGNNGELAAKGIAYNATLKAFDWINDVQEMRALGSRYGFSDILEQGKILVANTSYGFDPIYYQNYQFGKYNQMAKDWDDVMCNTPYFQIVKSAGNTRDDDPNLVPQVTVKSGYDLLEGAGVSKNVLVIGSVNSSKITSAFSSFGPTDDGRIKPDLVAKGENVYSSIESTNNSYALYNGTSSAAASVSAGITLLQQYARTKMYNYLNSSTIRALLIHTVEDIAPVGPDYKNGWGIPDFNNAANLLDNLKVSSMIKASSEEILKSGEKHRISIAAKGGEPLIVTLAWTDPSGDLDTGTNLTTADLTTSKLKNDLDVRIERLNSDGTIKNYYPWKLGGMAARTANPTNNSTNDVDNLEKIEITDVPQTGGLYTIVINHKGTSIVNSCTITGQPYSLVISGISYCLNDITLLQNQDNINISNTVIKARKITASNKITSLNGVPAKNVQYYASESIELIPQGNNGFQTETGTEFLAQIADCGPTMQNLPNSNQIVTNFSEEKPDITDPKIKEISSGMRIYPNPTINEVVNIEFNLENPSILNFEMYDLTGSLIIRELGYVEYPKGKNIKTLNLQGIIKGTYLLRVQTSEGEKTFKLIKN